jgi:hypothetical protein
LPACRLPQEVERDAGREHWPSREEEQVRERIYELVWSEPMFTLCKRFGLSDNGLRKRCKAMQVPTPPQGYWQALKSGRPIARARLRAL